MSNFVTVLRGSYRGTEIVNKSFPLLKPFKASSSGIGGHVTVDGSMHLGSNRNRIRIKVASASDIVTNANPIATEPVRFVEPNHVLSVDHVVETQTHETDEEIMHRIGKRFEILNEMTKSVVAGEIRAMIISGPPGVGKSFGVEHEIDKAVLADKIAGREIRSELVKGSSTAVALYAKLYQYSDPGSILVLDDVDTVFTDMISLNILKSVLDTGKRRKVSWLADSHMLRREDIPDSFEFKGSVIFITNMDFGHIRSKSLKDHLEALESRCHVIDLTIRTTREKVLRIKQIAKSGQLFDGYGFSGREEEEIVSFITDNHHNLREISLRTAIKIGDLRRAFPGRWQEMAQVTVMKSAR